MTHADRHDTEKLPDLMIRLVDAVDNPALGLCLDTGHQHLFSDLPLRDWVRRMAPRLRHIHLHDNDRSRDAHWPLGRGTIDFGTFFAALSEYAPDVTLVVEVEDAMPVKLANLRMLAAHFADV